MQSEWYIIIILVVFLIVIGYKVRWLQQSNIKLEDNYNKVLSQKKSSEVRLGKTSENLAPFISAWPFDPNNFRFLGNPIDGVSFEEDAVYFVEIKTGRARLSNGQKNIKHLVKEGKVYFATFRISEDGCSLKIEEE
jgi:Predicted secreted endonuclease distantly related to archaeal Holliday junction resolvase